MYKLNLKVPSNKYFFLNYSLVVFSKMTVAASVLCGSVYIFLTNLSTVNASKSACVNFQSVMELNYIC